MGDIFLKLARIVMVACIVVSSFLSFMARTDQAEPTLEPPAWPTWVHEHWVWENAGTQESALQFASDFIEKGIPVGAVIIDRPWATDSNTFIPDPERYPDLSEYVDVFHSMDIKVIMWATSVINETASNFQEGKDKGYFLSGGKTVKWWGGKGAFIDYTNPQAVDWWHSQMDNILDMGIDGWKVDGTDPYVMLLMPAAAHDGKLITWSDYKDQCYRDFFEYTRSKLGNDRVISARPVDDQLLQVGLPLVSTSRDINFAGWVGDNDNDWGGLQHALNNMFSSAEFNFVSYGSDIGGFRSDGNTYKDVFIRWAQLGAFCPVMENGGSGEHRPWAYDEQTLDIYRKYTILHHQLIPYIYSQAAYSYELVKPTMRPQPGEYIYLLGDDILVAPMFEQGDERTILFPQGEWISIVDDTKQYTEGIKKLSFSLEDFPAFIRKGAIIPMNVTCDATGHGTSFSDGYTTVLIYPQQGEKKFGLYEQDKEGSLISYVKNDGSLNISCTATERSLLFRVYGESDAASVKTANGNLPRALSMQALTAMQSGYFIDGDVLWIAVKNAQDGIGLNVTY
ncbi:MAG: Alpha-xylosidase [Firmicutes bacterium ADurb.Bin300]|nr:MAG: Alpha-xylosidase [Firmicutes bacterium ADurb.Bin300]